METQADYPNQERAILKLLASNDMRGMELVCEHVAPRVKTRLLRRFRAHNAELIDDALVDAAVRVWEQRARFDPTKGRLVTWYAAIATNFLIGELRLRAAGPLLRMTGIMDAVTEEGVGSGPSGSRQSELIQSRLVQGLIEALPACIDELPNLQREIILADLEAGERVSATELAERFGTTPNSVSVSRNKAHHRLGKLLREQWEMELVS